MFTTKTLSAAALAMATMVEAKLDHDCFVVGRMRGDPDPKNPLSSDLPKLLNGFKPNMRLDTLSVFSTSKGKDSSGKYIDRLDAV